MRILTVLLLVGCGDSTGIIDCDPATYLDPACKSSERCDATTKKCEAAKSCTTEGDCSGYACSVSNLCERNCTGQGGPDDSYCASAHACTPSFACVVSPSCTDDTPCGSYACDLTQAACRFACTGDTHCAAGKTCDTTTRTCK
jgi:hypothetical protein